MRSPIYLILLTFLFIVETTAAQPLQYSYEFNRKGELMKGPPSLLKPSSVINIKIAFDLPGFKAQVDSIQGAILEALAFWQSRQTKVAAMNPPPDYLIKINSLVDDLKRLYDFFWYKTTGDLLSFSSCLCKPISPADNDHSYTYTPSPRFILEELVSQFTVKMDCENKNCLEELPLCLEPDCCGNYFFAGKCSANQPKLEIYVYKNDPTKNLTTDWFNGQVGLFDYTNIMIFENIISSDKLFPLVLKYLSGKEKHDGGCKDLNELSKLIKAWNGSPTMDYYKTNPNILKNAFEYMLHLVWLNHHGELSINPFGFTNPSLYRQLGGSASKKDSIDPTAISKAEKVLTSQGLNLKNHTDYFSLLHKRDSMISRSDSLKLASAKDDKTAQSKKESGNSQAMLSYQYGATLRNKVISPVSLRDDSALHIRNYFFNRTPDKRDFCYEYPDNEKVVLAVHNVPVLNNINTISKLVDYNEQPMIVKEGLAAVNNLDPKGQGLGTILPTIPSLWAPSSAFAKILSEDLTEIPDQEEICRKNYDKLLAGFQLDFRKFSFFDSIYGGSQLPPLFLQKNFPDSPELRTELSFPDGGNKAPFEFDYKLAVKDTVKNSAGIQIDSSYYKIAKRRFIELSMGISYAVTHTRQVNVDTTNGNFAISNTENKIQFLVGLKFHLKKIYWGNNHFVGTKGDNTHDQVLERISVFAGLSVPNPLNNFYMGAGVDLIPGLNINTGVQWFRYTKFQINNNKIVDKASIYKPALYLAVTTDPLLFIHVVTTFFK
jgi:hypothetical protein